uniref:Uncharacterized protein n=1 Tax=Arundo donax TaxID=35708 RepID=A0A0A9BSJ9_ARUDO
MGREGGVATSPHLGGRSARWTQHACVGGGSGTLSVELQSDLVTPWPDPGRCGGSQPPGRAEVPTWAAARWGSEEISRSFFSNEILCIAFGWLLANAEDALGGL